MSSQANIAIEFRGPFGWLSSGGVPTLAESSNAETCGIYLWTVLTDQGELVYYIGQTGKSFRERMGQHLQQQLGGMYHIYEPELLACGVKRVLWNGMYGPNKEQGLDAFAERLPALAEALSGFIRVLRFWLGPIECDSQMRNRIEGALARHLSKQPDPVGSFQDEGVRYVPRRETEEPVTVRFRSAGAVLGLPEELEV